MSEALLSPVPPAKRSPERIHQRLIDERGVDIAETTMRQYARGATTVRLLVMRASFSGAALRTAQQPKTRLGA